MLSMGRSSLGTSIAANFSARLLTLGGLTGGEAGSRPAGYNFGRFLMRCFHSCTLPSRTHRSRASFNTIAHPLLKRSFSIAQSALLYFDVFGGTEDRRNLRGAGFLT